MGEVDYSVIGIEPQLSIDKFRGGLYSRYKPAEGPCVMSGAVFTVLAPFEKFTDKDDNNSLVMLLESESDQAWHERRNTALKKGEEAGTKMVLPMMLNMVVVMMVIMIPAMLSFY